MVNYGWQEVTLQMRAEWRSALTMCGVLCVVTPGEGQLPPWYVDNWDTSLKVGPSF